MFLKLLIISVLLLVMAFAFLGIRILLKPRGKFPDTHISHNKEMLERGITCAQHTDIGCTPGDVLEGCSVCSIKNTGVGRQASGIRE